MYRKTEKAIRREVTEKEMFESKDKSVLDKLKELRSKICQKLQHQR